MPKHKVFFDQYGRSASYVKKRKRGEGPRTILIPGDSDEDAIQSSDDALSLPELSSENLDNCLVDHLLDVDTADNVQYEYHDDASDIDGGSVTSDDLQFDDGTYLEFDDNEDNEEYYAAENGDEDNPLFDGASVTLSQSMLAIFSYALCHNLTGTAMGDLVTLICLLCVESCILKKSLYLFRKYFDMIRYPLKKHFFCSICFSRLVARDSVCELSDDHSGVSYFIEIPIITQLQMLFNRPGFYQSLQQRFDQAKNHSTNLDDIYDGEVYKELSSDDGFLATSSNISFTWNTDGVAIFKSSGFQIWPFYLVINELPFRDRTRSDNILLAGLWFGSQKPSPNIFMQPFTTTFEELSEGVYLNVPNRESPVKVNGKVICGTCDLPAKALFLNITQ